MLLRVLIFYLIQVSFASAQTVTYSSMFNYYDGGTYPSNLRSTEIFMTFTGSEVQPTLPMYDQIYQEITFSFTYQGMLLALDVDESTADIYGLDANIYIYVRGTETNSIPGQVSGWGFLSRGQTWPSSDGFVYSESIYNYTDPFGNGRGMYGESRRTHIVWTNVAVPVPGALWLFVTGVVTLLHFAGWRKS